MCMHGWINVILSITLVYSPYPIYDCTCLHNLAIQYLLRTGSCPGLIITVGHQLKSTQNSRDGRLVQGMFGHLTDQRNLGI